MHASEKKVARCYSLLDLHRAAGMLDLTEGLYGGDPLMSYGEAQQQQIAALLDRVHCTSGSSILDIGCGYGTLVSAARRRAASAIGVTISPEQRKYCVESGLDVELLNYRNALEVHPDWRGKFSGIIANGSMEHFVQPKDALAYNQDKLYRELFDICRALLRPGGRFATTCIHFIRRPDPCEIVRGPWVHPRGSELFHLSMLMHMGGAFYPCGDQLERCAQRCFTLHGQMEHTEDYRRTSEEWLRQWKRAFLKPRFYAKVIPGFLRGPRSFVDGFICLLVAQSWNWQFRPPAPTRLLHQTWVRCD